MLLLRLLLVVAACHALVGVTDLAPHRPHIARRSLLSVRSTPDAAWSRSPPLTMLSSIRSTAAAAPAAEPSPTAVLGACFAVSVATGSFYCWSLLLPMLQASLGCARAPLSAVFSLSTVCFTCGTSLGAQLLPSLPGPMAAVLMIGSGVATGLIAASCHAIPAAKATGLLVLALGWSLGFGTMSGLACAPSGPVPSLNRARTLAALTAHPLGLSQTHSTSRSPTRTCSRGATASPRAFSSRAAPGRRRSSHPWCR